MLSAHVPLFGFREYTALNILFAGMQSLALISSMVAITLTAKPAQAKSPEVRTIAGSGAAGISDGSAASATFMAPSALAFDTAGNILIADAGAQRIRSLGEDGTVTTVAGGGDVTLFGLGVGGGYIDGPAITARFDLPSGIAIARNGDIYIADTGNNCIRKLSHGIVSTFAGHPTEDIAQDGPGSSATFRAPRSVALDREGNIYVADVGVGIRTISPQGVVGTIEFDGSKNTLALAVYDDGKTKTLFVSTDSEIVFYDLSSQSVRGAIPIQPNSNTDERIDGHELIGPAAAIATLGPREFVAVSPLMSSVVYVGASEHFNQIYVRELGARTQLNAQRFGGQFRDGDGARFAQPLGVAVRRDGAIVIADTENRRIRSISAFDRRNFESSPFVLPDVADPGVFRVGVLGSSHIWYDTDWDDSIEAVAAREIEAAPGFKKSGKRLEVLPIRLDNLYLDLELDYALNEVAPRPLDVIATCFWEPEAQYGTRVGESRLLRPVTDAEIDGFLQIQNIAASTGRFAFALYFPIGGNIIGQNTYSSLASLQVLPHEPADVERIHDSLIAKFRAKGINFVDLWPTFATYLQKDVHDPITSALDPHNTPISDAMIGDAIAKEVIKEQRWSSGSTP